MNDTLPLTMKALVLHGVGRLSYEDVPVPQTRPGTVLLKLKACGICASDIPRVYETGTYHFPTIPGHELSGQIVKLGEGVDKSLLHRRATVFPLMPCMKCGACQIGEYAQCTDYNYFGSRCDGGFAEYLCVPVWNIVPLPDNVSYTNAALSEPAAVSLHALSLADLKPGQTVAVVGTGTIGFLTASFCRMAGASRVIVIGESPDKLEFAKRRGFLTINSRKQDVDRQIALLTGQRGADLTLECVGSSNALENAIRACGNFGEVIMVGNPSGDITLHRDVYWRILRRQIHVRGSWNSSYNDYRNDWKAILALLETGRMDLDPYITHTFDLCDYQQAFDIFRDRSRFTLKVMFTM